MSTFFALLAAYLITTAFAGSMLSVNFSDCTRANSKAAITKVVFEPAQPQIGKNFTAIGEVTFSENVPQGSYLINVSAGVVNPTAEGSLCDSNVVKFPFNLGDIYYSAHSCPIPAGPTNISITAFISSSAPDGTVDTRYTAYDKPEQNGNELFCMDITSVISG
mmetsp:Transcript_44626/g.71420  ORF Transcript_44626/g.71420 Transcript_44626/m.71420 type:complete len:163 (-) Transcript_44626:58-546(-)